MSVSGWLVNVGDLWHYWPPYGSHWCYIWPTYSYKMCRTTLIHTGTQTCSLTENSPDHWLSQNTGIVASHSGHFHSSSVCESAVVFRLVARHCSGQAENTLLLSYNHSVMTESNRTQFQSRQNIKIIPLLCYSHCADVSKSVTIVTLFLTQCAYITAFCFTLWKYIN